MNNFDAVLDDIDGEHRVALDWFRHNAGTEQAWTDIKDLDRIGARLVNQAKGIYKPAGKDYALSVRQTLSSKYADKTVMYRPDGSWVYEYFQENPDPNQRDKAFTNRGLVYCMKQGIPVGVLLQSKPKPGVRYKVLGLALVRDWNDGYFVLEGFSKFGQIRPANLPSAAIDRASSPKPEFHIHLQTDERKKRLIAIALRQGQPKFRQGLLEAYNGRCAITGTDAISALEAAHIAPYRGDRSNHLQNGLLLRADIHSLFDLGMIGINPKEMKVVISPDLMESTYGELDGRSVNLPADIDAHPSNAALCNHLKWAGLN